MRRWARVGARIDAVASGRRYPVTYAYVLVAAAVVAVAGGR